MTFLHLKHALGSISDLLKVWNFLQRSIWTYIALNHERNLFFGNPNIPFMYDNMWKNFCRIKTFPETNEFCRNQMNAIHSFVVIFTARFPQSHEFPKYPKIVKKNIYSFFSCAYVSKFPHCLKSAANSTHAICHFLQVWSGYKWSILLGQWGKSQKQNCY